jgi:hypothetical protein
VSAACGSAEWIIERNNPPLSHFASPFIFSSAMAEKNGTWNCVGVLPHAAVDMYESGSKIAYPSAFTDPGNYCNFPVNRTSSF